LQALDEALNHNKLLKVKFDDFKAEKKSLSPQIAEKTAVGLSCAWAMCWCFTGQSDGIRLGARTRQSVVNRLGSRVTEEDAALFIAADQNECAMAFRKRTVQSIHQLRLPYFTPAASSGML